MKATIAKYTPKSVKSMVKRSIRLNSLQMSQAGQDLWVFGEVFNEMKGGYFLDLGAHNGIDISNTYLLEQKYGWTGICVEANPDSFQKLKENRRATCIQACLDATEGFVNFAKKELYGGIVAADTDNKGTHSTTEEVVRIETKTLENVLIENKAPTEIDYLSIDVEGAEERILRNFDFRKYRFKCITIERPTDWIRAILKENGYVLVREIPGLDCFYIHESISEQYPLNLMRFYDKRRLTLRWK